MITESFDNITQPIMSLKDFYGEQKHIIDRCIVTFSHEIYQHLLENFDCVEIAQIETANGSTPIYMFQYDGMKLGFYLSAIGSTLASEFVIEANWITGADKFIMFGSAGSLDKAATENRYVIPTESYRDEGMSYHYAPAADYIGIKNHNTVKSILDELNLPNTEGRVWTTDAFLRETAGQAAKRRAEGCIAVEMELAGVQAVCDFHGLELYDFLVTGDVLSDEAYTTDGLTEANHNVDKLYVALEIAKRV